LEIEAKAVLRKYRPKIIAVTGSVGKTSTKDAIFTVISKSFYARKSEKSFNSDIGVPLTILGCQNAWSDPVKWLQNIWQGIMMIVSKQAYPEWLVLEVGADRPGDIKKISSWLKPDVVVMTKFSKVPVHVEFFKNKDEVVAEKGHLVEALKHDGTLVLNSDDEDVYSFKKKFHNKIISFGTIGEIDVKGSNVSICYENDQPIGIQFKIEYDGNVIPVKLLGSLGAANIYSALAAISVGVSLGLNVVEMTERLANHESPRGRMKLVSGLKNTTLIDDTYNSSPVALHSALQTLGEIETKGRKIAVLGDMMELGKHSAEAHKEGGEMAAKVCDVLITVGMRSRILAEAALDDNLADSNIFQFDNSREAGEFLQDYLRSGDVILVKGSQSMRMERVVEEVMAQPEKAGDLLVRQEEEWLAR